VAHDMWQKSRTRLMTTTERQRLRTLERRKSREPHVASVAAPRPQHCPAVNYTGVYTRGYACEHAVGHVGPHRDKHMNEWDEEV
jgi:hypothetical protein